MAETGWAAPDVETWARAAALFTWENPPGQVWTPGPRHGNWFPGAQLDVVANLVGRHAARDPEAVAILWEGEPSDRRSVTYGALAEDVLGLARALRGLGVGRGDLVALHLGAIPELVTALLAAIHVGATTMVIPAPLPVDGLVERLEAATPRVLFTQDGAWRRGVVLPLKARADDALAAVAGIEHTIVVRRTGMDVGWYEGDRWYHDLMAGARPSRRGRGGAGGKDGVPLGVTDPLLLASLPKRAGQPVTASLGVGSLIAAAALHRGALADGPVVWVAGEMSWPGTQLHGVLGPLALGGTLVLCEGTLDVPYPTQAWSVMNRHGVTTFVTVPSVLRRLRTWARDLPTLPPLPELRRVVSVGEPLDAELRAWVGHDLAGHHVTTADGWGQVELGGVVHVDHPLVPEAVPDLGLSLVGADGRPVPDGEVGEMVITRPGAGMVLGTAGSPELEATHWRGGDGPYYTGDRARRGPDGGLEFLGRIDQVVSVSGQLVSLGEVRSLLAEHPFTREVDVLERGGPDGSRYLAAGVVLAPGAPAHDLPRVAAELNRSVRELLGGLCCPQLFLIVDRYGDELRGDERRRALAAVHVPPGETTAAVSWAQVLAAAPDPG